VFTGLSADHSTGFASRSAACAVDGLAQASHAWEDWSHGCGTDLGALPIAEAFNHFYLLIQAAKCGLGMANVPRMLVHDDLNSGTLVAPLGFLAGPNKLSLWVAPHLSRRSDTVRLVDWLTEELRTSERPVRASGG
jgi:LysR family glycine cleavage system transcriptional activator